MEAITEHLTGYPAIYLVCCAIGVIIPMPEEVVVLIVSLGVARGDLDLGPTIVAATLGVMTRDLIGYALGRYLFGWLDRKVIARIEPLAKRVDRAKQLVARRGAASAVAGRFLTGMKVPVFVVCGWARVPITRFILWDFAVIVVMIPALVLIGARFGQPVADFVAELMPQAGRVIPIAFVIIFGIFWLRRRRQLAAKEDEGTDGAAAAEPPERGD